MTTSQLPVYRRSELQDIAAGCLYRWHKLWVEGINDASDISLVGVAFHAVNHRYLMRLVDRKLPSDHEEAEAAFIEGVATSQLPPRLIPELRSLWTFHVSRFSFDPNRFVASEERGVEDGKAWTPDLAQAHPETNALEVVDFKSGWHPPLTEAELRNDFQARFYSRYARERWRNFSEYHFTLHAVRFNKRVTVQFTPAELDAVDSEIQATITTVELAKAAKAYPAIPGTACRFCTLKCPVVDNKLVLPKRLTLEQRQPVAEWVLVAEKQLKQVKTALKESVKAHGPIDVRGVVWDNRPSVSRSYPLGAVQEAFRRLKIDKVALELIIPGGELTLSQAALKGVLRAYPDLAPMLQASERQKTTFRFSAKATGEEESDDD